MNRLYLIIFFINFILSNEYNLDSLIKIGLENSPSINLAVEELKKARANSIEARSTALPKVQIFTSGTKNFNIAGQPISFPIFPGLLDQFGNPVSNDSLSYFQATGLIMSEIDLPMGTDYSGVFGINFNQTLFDGRVFAAIRASKIYDTYTEESYNEIVEKVIENIKISFYSVLLTKKVFKVFKKSLERAKSNFKNTELLFESGNVNELELIRAESLVKDQETFLKNAEKNKILALEQLCLVIGIKNVDNLNIIGSFKEINFNILSLENYEKKLLKNQSQIRQLEASYLLSKENIKTYLSEFYPSISLSGAIHKIQSKNKEDFKFEFEHFQDNTSLSINLSLPIFDGFGSKARVMKAKADAKKIKYQSEDLKNNLLLELKSIYLNLNESMEKIYAGETKLELAKKGYSIASDLFKNGMTTQLDLLGAEINLNQAELNLIQAKFEYQIEMAKLSRSIGENTERIK
ncbi:MAG: hypothetical protein CMF96_01345 [Candidatus Marinimicrobia bacterium]|nr:hypothetical protein [Candidatus Neomarinimicrobiota bacterium]|tara:strand:- start:3597 stop:4988 length:1392 start_codon:yes stop_codon:yes gene_type:complete